MDRAIALAIWLLFALLVLMCQTNKKLSDTVGLIGVGVLLVVILNFLVP